MSRTESSCWVILFRPINTTFPNVSLDTGRNGVILIVQTKLWWNLQAAGINGHSCAMIH